MNRRQTILVETNQHLEGSEYPEQCDGTNCWLCNPMTVEDYRLLNQLRLEWGNLEPIKPPPLYLVPTPDYYADPAPLQVALRDLLNH